MTTRRLMIAMALGLNLEGLLAQPRAGQERHYNPKTVETVVGEVTAVERMMAGKRRGGGVHLMLQTGTEQIAVHLGPSWFIDEQDVKVATGDKIEVRGSRVQFDGKPAIVAATVTKGGQEMKLRNAKGIPRWSRARKK